MTEPKYGPWIAHNATADSVCPVMDGARGQVMLASQTRDEAEEAPIREMLSEWMRMWDLKDGRQSRIAFYRVLIEPVRDVRTERYQKWQRTYVDAWPQFIEVRAEFIDGEFVRFILPADAAMETNPEKTND